MWTLSCLFGIANDVPEGGNFIHQYEAMLLNTTKPIIVTISRLLLWVNAVATMPKIAPLNGLLVIRDQSQMKCIDVSKK